MRDCRSPAASALPGQGRQQRGIGQAGVRQAEGTLRAGQTARELLPPPHGVNAESASVVGLTSFGGCGGSGGTIRVEQLEAT